MGHYEPNLLFEDYMKTRISVAATRDEALSKNAIDALIEADLALVHVPSLKLSGPHIMEDVSAAWLTEVLGEGISGAALIDSSIDQEHTGMTDRRLLKLQWNEVGVQAGLPGSIFVKATPTSASHRESLAIFHMSANEVHFYQTIRPEIPILAPEAFYARNYPGGRFLLLLQDLHAIGCRPYGLGKGCSVEHARSVVTALAQLHSKYWESERFTSDLAWVRPRTHRFGWPWQHHSFVDARATYLQSDEGKSMPSEHLALLELWNQHDTTVYNYLDKRPCTVLHGDTHLGNTFGYPDGSAGLFDWQVMFRGSGLRDVCYFVLSSLTKDQRHKHEREIFDLYLALLAEGGIVLDRRLAWQEYCLYAFDSLDSSLKTIVRASYGHPLPALSRGVISIMDFLLEHDVPALLKHLIHHGRL